MSGLYAPSPGGRTRIRAIRALFSNHRYECTPEGRACRLLREWLSPAQRTQFTRSRYFDVVGGQTGTSYRIYPGTSMNVYALDCCGRAHRGLCFMPVGELPIGDVMLAQKLALESCEGNALAIAKQFTPRGSYFRPTSLTGHV
jgi:hypothetical protein